MKKDVYTLEEMKELNIITDHYQMITAPEIVTAQLEMKAECKDKYTLRVFFSCTARLFRRRILSSPQPIFGNSGG